MDSQVGINTSELCYRFNPSIKVQDIEPRSSDDTKLVPVESRLSVLRSCRWVLAYVCFGGMVLVFGTRASFVMALVCLFPEEPDVEAELERNADHVVERSSFKTWYNFSDTEIDNGIWPNGTNLFNNDTLQFTWDDKTQGFALSAYNYGFLISPIIGGYIATHSAKYVLVVSMFVSAVATLLTPYIIGISAYYAIALRIVVGICGGVCVPAIQDLWSKWAPKEERGKLTAFTHSGKMIGNVLTFGLTGVLCTVKLLGGWPIIFYGLGFLSIIWIVLAIFTVYDSPEKHPRITENEKEYIQGTTGKTKTDEKQVKMKTPWLKISTSLPVWACLICKLSSAYGLAVQTANMPMWVRDVLKFEIEENGLFSALPYVGQFIGSLLAGIVLDALHRTPFSVTVVRKLTFAVCLLLPGSAIFSLAFLGYEHRAIAICLTVVASTTYAAIPISLRIVIIEMAPKYAGIIMGMMMTIGSLPGLFAPLVTSIITRRGTTDEWHYVFYMCGGFYALAAIVFLAIGSGKEQPWAHEHIDKEIIIEAKDKAGHGGLSDEEIKAGRFDIESNIEGIEEKRTVQVAVGNSDPSRDSGIWMCEISEVGNVVADAASEFNSHSDPNATIVGIENQCFVGDGGRESRACAEGIDPIVHERASGSRAIEGVAAQLLEDIVNDIDKQSNETNSSVVYTDSTNPVKGKRKTDDLSCDSLPDVVVCSSTILHQDVNSAPSSEYYFPVTQVKTNRSTKQKRISCQNYETPLCDSQTLNEHDETKHEYLHESTTL